ncbi:MAG: FAD-dependent thymidylate synthase [Patescibacteria group bacterium]|nr:FAD-dependent thymidylate synthase [Patescibacteria group bacterium]
MAKIFIYDEFSPEDIAMMQALYSRSPKSVEDHVRKVKESGSGKFMEKFYVGYGHSSIADCGSATIFIEGVSMLADKAIQDWQLYAGQETSTRYIDMSAQPIVNPLKTEKSKEILDKWMEFYINNQEELKRHLIKKYPRKKDEDESVYLKAIDARSFDIMRGFLPAGITTQLSWHTNLRQAWDKLSLLKHHPLVEVRKITEIALFKLKEKYSHSFSHKFYESQEKYREKIVAKYNYYNPQNIENDFFYKTNISITELNQYEDIIKTRPIKTNLPVFLAELGNITFNFFLDFGSFRDIQRHRNGICRMPLLTTKIGFNQWYLEQLPENLKKKAQKLISAQIKNIDNLDASLEIKQYYIAMGFNVACKVSYGLPATIYTIELRSGKLVHPTLRKIAHKMHQAIKKEFPNLILHSDMDLDNWDIRRGLQDIKEKNN